MALSPEARAIEAVLMVAVEPVPEGLLAELLELPVEQIEPFCAELALRLPRRGPSTFRELTGHLTSRIEIIVRFLALLELCKQGRVSLDQGHTFGDLSVAWVPDAPDAVSVGSAVTDEYEG